MIADALLSEVLDRIATQAGAPEELLLAELRQAFPGVHFSVCRDDDMPARMSPAAQNAVCCLYYVTSTSHCLSLSTDAESASGLVVALVDRDEP